MSVNPDVTTTKNESSLEKDSFKPEHKFNSKTTALEVLENIDLTNKTFLITGTTAGIGFETARALALHGGHIIMANRDVFKSKQIKNSIYKETTYQKIDIIEVDFSSLKSVKNAAEEIISKNCPIDCLILNAGLFGPPNKATIDGFESTFQINYLGQFYLTYLLLDKLRQSSSSRIVIVSSSLHARTNINPNALITDQLKKLIPSSNHNENAFRLYAYSKMCNVLMAFKIHREEYKKNNIYSYVVHPGDLIGTKISRSFGIFGKIFVFISKPFVKTIEQGAATTVYCAAYLPILESGKFYENCWNDEKILQKPLAHNEALQDALWEKSLEYIKNFEKNLKKG